MANNKTSEAMESEENLTFDQVKEQLVEQGKKRGFLAFEESADRLSNFVIEHDQMDEFYEDLGEQGIEIIDDETKEDDDDDTTDEEVKDEDLSVPLGVKIN